MEPKYIDLKKVFGRYSEVVYVLLLILWTAAAFLGGKASNNINITNINKGDNALGLEAPNPNTLTAT